MIVQIKKTITPKGGPARQAGAPGNLGFTLRHALPSRAVNQVPVSRILPCGVCGLYFMRVTPVRPEKQQSIKLGFNVSKLGFAFWENSKYTSTHLGKEQCVSARAAKNGTRLNWQWAELKDSKGLAGVICKCSYAD